MRYFPIIIALAALVVSLSGCGDVGATDSQPNILIVVLDAVRADHVGSYGYERNTTPNIDAFARHSVQYANCFSTCSWTKPSVTSLLTGLNCREHGILAAFDPLSEDLPYLPATMRQRGYTTAIFSGNLFVCWQDGFDRGCDHFWQFAPDESWRGAWEQKHVLDDAVVVNNAIPWIRDTRKPWFCYVHLMGPHAPYEKPARAHDFGEKPVDLYNSKLRYVDAQVGRLLAAVPLDTVVIVTADHGEEFGEHGGTKHGKTLYDEVVHVPLLIRWPGHESKIETELVGLDRLYDAILEERLPETGGEVRCDLERRDGNRRLQEQLKRIITEADIETDEAPDLDPEKARQEQLKALGYL